MPRKRTSGYAGVRKNAEGTPARLATGPGYVLYSIVDFIVDHYQPCMDTLDYRFRQVEKDPFRPDPPAGNPGKVRVREMINTAMQVHAPQASARRPVVIAPMAARPATPGDTIGAGLGLQEKR